MTAFPKNAGHLEIRAPPSTSPPETRPGRLPRFGPEQPAAPDIQTTRLRQNLDLGIPTPMARQTSALRATLEHVARGAEYAAGIPEFQIPSFGDAKVKLDESAAAISGIPMS
jgi:hypothetical protein